MPFNVIDGNLHYLFDPLYMNKGVKSLFSGVHETSTSMTLPHFGYCTYGNCVMKMTFHIEEIHVQPGPFTIVITFAGVSSVGTDVVHPIILKDTVVHPSLGVGNVYKEHIP
jgi:hypothetical protein